MQIKDQKIKDFLNDLSSKKPTPGGGAASALAGATGAALVSKVAILSQKREKAGEFKKIEKKANQLEKELLRMADEDCQAFERVMKAYRIKREEKIQEALKEAALLPLRTAEKSVEVVKLASYCTKEGNQKAVSDVRVGIELATSAVYGALENVRINLEEIKDEKFCGEIKDEMEELLGCEDLKSG